MLFFRILILQNILRKINKCHFSAGYFMFIGRKHELKQLHDLKYHHGSHLVVIKGRRRVGKSRLVQEFAKGKAFFSFSGLPPEEKLEAQDQRDHFSHQLSTQLNQPLARFHQWSQAFDYLAHFLPDTPCVVLFDEISWMAMKDKTFLPKLKSWWDDFSSKRDNVIVVLCGSISTWIEKNILNSTAFFGRIRLQIDLAPLSLPECNLFLKELGFKGSIYEIFKILSITGGIPWYLEQISSHYTADDNIKRLCFEKSGNLVGEFDKIFNDLFSSRGEIYKKLIEILAQGMKNQKTIAEMLKYSDSGTLSEHLSILQCCGFISRHYQWSLSTSKIGKQSLYRLSDNYLRFYSKYIAPQKEKISQHHFKDMTLSMLPGFETLFGLQVENLLLNNRDLLLKALDIPPQEVIADNPYSQKPTLRKKGCQIDYLIQTRQHQLFVCEFKFHRGILGSEVIESVQEKIARLAVPRHWAVIPVLFHLGEVSDGIVEKSYFYRLVEMGNLLE
jgi:AAA+ ATPase superfamily predicted ATPase